MITLEQGQGQGRETDRQTRQADRQGEADKADGRT